MSIGLLRLSRYATRLKDLKPRKNKSASSVRQLKKEYFYKQQIDDCPYLFSGWIHNVLAEAVWL